jgi:hypothetical protein
MCCNNFVNDIEMNTNMSRYDKFFVNLVTIVELHLSFTAVSSKHREMINMGTQFFRLTKMIPKPEVVSLNLSWNYAGLSIFRDFMDQNPMLTFVSNLSLRLDGCNLHDDEIINLHLLTKVFKLEHLELSIENNHLTDNMLPHLLIFLRFKQLKEIKVFLGGNKFSNEAVDRVANEFKLIKCKIYRSL